MTSSDSVSILLPQAVERLILDLLVHSGGADKYIIYITEAGLECESSQHFVH